MFAFLPTVVLALSTGAYAQLSSSGFATPSPQTSSPSPTFITTSSAATFITTTSRAASTVITTSSAASSSIPIFSCVVFVGGTTSSVAPSPTFFSSSASSFVETFSSVTSTPETFSSSASTNDHGFHSSQLLIASFPSSSASNDDFSSFSSAQRPLTTTISASIGTFSGTATTIYATGSVSIANPGSLPTCSGPSSGPITTATGSSASSSPAGSQTALDSNGGKKPSAGVIVGQSSVGIAFGALVGIGLVLF